MNGQMKLKRILFIRTIVVILFVCCTSLPADGWIVRDTLQLPACFLNGKQHVLLSSEKSYGIDWELSKYVKQNLPIMRYDMSQFRFLVSMMINKRGKVKEIHLLNRGSFKNNMPAWKETKDIIKKVHFSPAKLNGKEIVYRPTFYIQLDFTTPE